MLYERSRKIESRLEKIVGLIRTGGQSTLTLAKAFGISRPTVSRSIAALRKRGYTIRAVKDSDGWAYEITADPVTTSQG
jgi:biotin operon repressor